MRFLEELRAIARQAGPLALLLVAAAVTGSVAVWVAGQCAHPVAARASVSICLILACGGQMFAAKSITRERAAAANFRLETDGQTHLLNTVSEKLPVYLYLKDREGKFTQVNEIMSDRLGLMDISEAVGRRHEDFFHPEYAQAVREIELSVHTTGKPALHKEELESSEEIGDAWVSVSRFPLRDIDEGCIGMLCISQDMTARNFTELALEGVNIQLTGWVTELEQQSDHTVHLSEMREMLQTCLDEEEATTIIHRYAQGLFSCGSGVLPTMRPSQNYVEAVAAWGSSVTSEYMFAAEQYWELRRGRLHAIEQGDRNVRCSHVLDGFQRSALCLPMMARGEVLGVLHGDAGKRPNLKFSGRPIGLVTASIGVAMSPEHAQPVDTLVKAADTALYEAKHSGRDRVAMAVETYA